MVKSYVSDLTVSIACKCEMTETSLALLTEI